MNWKINIEEQIKQASKERKIHSSLKKLGKLLLSGDSEFYLVYSGSKEQYKAIRFKNGISILTGKILLKNGYKNFYLNNKI
jgi:hypothetical protein